MQQDVRNVTRTVYRSYMKSCMGKDEFIPVSGSCADWFNVGLTVLDSLDTLILMDLRDEYEASRKWAQSSLSFYDVDTKISLFEIVIRATAGLNSAYILTGDKLWLNKTLELADMLLHSFSLTKTGCPPPHVYIGDDVPNRMSSESVEAYSNPAEAGTLQLEFRTLSYISGDPKYATAVDRCVASLTQNIPTDKLVTPTFDLRSAEYVGSRLSIGGGVDSFYEMLIKTWIAYGKKDQSLRMHYENSVAAITKTLSRKKGDLLYAGEMYRDRAESFQHTMDHLACFFPGNLAVAALHGLGGGVNGTSADDYMPIARAMTRSCFAMSRATEVGLAGEITDFSGTKPAPKAGRDINFLRPEIVEALYYLDKTDPKAGRTYKDMGEQMWKDMRKWSQVPGAEDGLLSTTFNLLGGPKKMYHHGKLQSFAIAETFKYFFLLFDEREAMKGPFPLDKWVYNTEAHPVRIVSEKEGNE